VKGSYPHAKKCPVETSWQTLRSIRSVSKSRRGSSLSAGRLLRLTGFSNEWLPVWTSPPSGDRQANSALWHIVSTRIVCDPKTRHYIERRMKEGRAKKEGSAASSATSLGRCSQRSNAQSSLLTIHRGIVRG
jgi:hypothetical protein